MIYILLLEKEKYYVGYTERENGERFMEHFSNEGAAWTKKYKPIQVLEYREGTKDDEDKVTLELMNELGWFNVRGGRWCKVNMTRPPEELVEYVPMNVKKAIKSAVSKINESSSMPQYIEFDACYRCGRSNHYANNCYSHKDINGNLIEDERPSRTNKSYKCHQHVSNSVSYGNKAIDNYLADEYDSPSKTKKKQQKSKSDNCYKCGRSGHYASQCYAKTKI